MNSSNKRILVLSLVAQAVLLGGCATSNTYHTADANFATTQAETAGLQSDQERFRSQMTAKATEPKVQPFAYVDTTAIPVVKKLPSQFYKRVVFNEPNPIPLDQLIGKLSLITGMDVGYQNDLVDMGKRAEGSVGTAADNNSSTDSAGGTNTPTAPQILNISGLSSRGGDVVKKMKVSVSAQGTIKDVLDATAHAMDASWRYNEQANKVDFYRYKTETFTLSILPGTSNNQINLDTKGQDTGGGAKAKLIYDSKLSAWQSIRDALNTMISSKGAFSVSESTGTVTVRDVPDVVARVANYIKDVNDSFSRQVSIKVAVYKVQDNSSDTRGINWKAVFNSSRLTGTINTVALQPQNAASTLASIVLGMPANTPDYQPLAGSQGMIDSLSQVGKVSVLTSTDVSTVNNQPAPVRVTQTVAYLKSLTNTSTANVGSSVSLTPGEVDTGFSMQVLPHVQPNGRDMLMQVMVSLSTLDSLKTFSSGGSTIQLPQISSRDFVQRAWLRSGQSLVLAGFESTASNDSSGGVIDAAAWGLGGNKAVTNAKESIVIVITPVVTSAKNGI